MSMRKRRLTASERHDLYPHYLITAQNLSTRCMQTRNLVLNENN